MTSSHLLAWLWRYRRGLELDFALACLNRDEAAKRRIREQYMWAGFVALILAGS